VTSADQLLAMSDLLPAVWDTRACLITLTIWGRVVSGRSPDTATQLNARMSELGDEEALTDRAFSSATGRLKQVGTLLVTSNNLDSSRLPLSVRSDGHIHLHGNPPSRKEPTHEPVDGRRSVFDGETKLSPVGELSNRDSVRNELDGSFRRTAFTPRSSLIVVGANNHAASIGNVRRPVDSPAPSIATSIAAEPAFGARTGSHHPRGQQQAAALIGWLQDAWR